MSPDGNNSGSVAVITPFKIHTTGLVIFDREIM